jgi:hypothetical protein
MPSLPWVLQTLISSPCGGRSPEQGLEKIQLYTMCLDQSVYYVPDLTTFHRFTVWLIISINNFILLILSGCFI